MALFEGTPGDDSMVGTDADGDESEGFAALGGNDTITGLNGDDIVDGGPGTDTAVLRGDLADYRFALQIGAGNQGFQRLVSTDTVGGRDGVDDNYNIEWLRFADIELAWLDVPTLVTVAAASEATDTVSHVAGARNDTLEGHEGPNDFSGAAGDDSLLGQGGNDTLRGGEGDDLLDGGAGSNRLDGGAGNDTLLGTQGTATAVYRGMPGDYGLSLRTEAQGGGFVLTDTVAGRDGQDVLVGVGSVEFSNGSMTADALINLLGNTITGTAAAEVIDGTGYNDIISAAGGDDSVTGGGGNDTIMGGAGLDTASWSGPSSRYGLGIDGDARTVSDMMAQADGSDIATGVERLQFSDVAIAFDLDGNAGAAARLAGVLLGGHIVGDPGTMRTFISAFDQGYTALEIAQAAIDYLFPSATPQEVAESMFMNLAHRAPVEAESDFLSEILSTQTLAWLAVVAGDTPYSDNNIDFVGLVEDGVRYLPPGP